MTKDYRNFYSTSSSTSYNKKGSNHYAYSSKAQRISRNRFTRKSHSNFVGSANSSSGLGGLRPSAEDAHSVSNVAGLGLGSVSTANRPSQQAKGRMPSMPTSRTNPLISRRAFLIGAAGVGTAAAIAGGAVYLNKRAEQQAANAITSLDVPTNAVTLVTSAYEQLDDYTTRMQNAITVELPYGTLVFATDDAVAVCLIPTNGAAPLNTVSLLTLGGGQEIPLLEGAVGMNEGYEIYDVRASSSGIIWVEADILDNIWRVYGATLEGDSYTLGEVLLLDEGDSSLYETPTLGISGNYGFWQVLPKLGGEAITEDSLFKRTIFGSGNAEVIYASHGRMATPPYSCADSIVISPRVDTTGIYYQLTVIDAASGEERDTLVLPASMKPLEAAYGPTGFAFSLDAWYQYEEGLSSIGTYTPTSLPGADTEAYNSASWICYDRAPTAPPAWCSGNLIVKGRYSIVGVDIAAQETFVLDLDSGSDTYGEYLATTGEREGIVTFTNIDYTPLSGDATRCCRVKVWHAV